MEAFKDALTKEFVVIQGPPGTGKTYLGLKIVKTLIKNKHLWRNSINKTPILIICYTNYALDQFLEQLLDVTNRILRIGGQSKNEKLAAFNIKKLRKRNRCKMTSNILIQKQSQLRNIMSKIKCTEETLAEIENFDSIFKLTEFKLIDLQFRRSSFSSSGKDSWLEWLCGQEMNEKTEMCQNYKDKEYLDIYEEISTDDDGFYYSYESNDNDDISNNITVLPLLNVMLHTHELTASLKQLISKLNSTSNEVEFSILENKIEQLEYGLQQIQLYLKYGKQLMNLKQPPFMNYKNPFDMHIADRWKMYFYWLGSYHNCLLKKLSIYNAEYRNVYSEYNEIRDIDDINIMSEMLIVAMTTTSAVRLQSVLKAIKCKIVVVEEAAEILESHVVVSLTKHCEHLILLGDHQQLRPSTADYQMETQFKLGISLFERMILNELPHTVLNGHYYVIGECGGANQIGKCNECGANIGGSNHRLLDTNRHAGEIDGSRYAAWSVEANNYNNYDL